MNNDNWRNDFDKVRSVLQNLPDSPAAAAALQGLEKERQRRERDEKLQQKFSSKMNDYKDYSKVEKPDVKIDDWDHVGGSAGEDLSERVVQSIAAHGTLVASPVAAITVALHASLLQLGFACTGIVEAVPTGGFAAPIREITTFLPDHWDSNPIRYRKNGVGTMVLSVTSVVNKLSVSFGEKTENVFRVDISDYFNLESYRAATANNTRVSPTLHYKSLATLLNNFAKYFDLGDPAKSDSPKHYVDYTMTTTTTAKAPKQARIAETYQPPPPRQPVYPVGGGDFRGDLMPSGILPANPLAQPVPPGSEMGPNHPMFANRREFQPDLVGGGQPDLVGGGEFGGAGIPNVGGNYLHPRIDPVGPPGLDGGRRRQHEVPNNDLMRKPPFEGSDMWL